MGIADLVFPTVDSSEVRYIELGMLVSCYEGRGHTAENCKRALGILVKAHEDNALAIAEEATKKAEAGQSDRKELCDVYHCSPKEFKEQIATLEKALEKLGKK